MTEVICSFELLVMKEVIWFIQCLASFHTLIDKFLMLSTSKEWKDDKGQTCKHQLRC